MIPYSFASERKKPWVLTTQGLISQKDIPDNILLLELDAASMTSLEGLYREFSVVCKFPDYFGKNFNALDECVTDLEWLPADGYLLLIKNSECLLSEESDDTLESLLLILDSAGEEWARPVVEGEAWDREGVPFHTVLQLEKSKASGFQLRLKKLGLDIQDL